MANLQFPTFFCPTPFCVIQPNPYQLAKFVVLFGYRVYQVALGVPPLHSLLKLVKGVVVLIPPLGK